MPTRWSVCPASGDANGNAAPPVSVPRVAQKGKDVGRALSTVEQKALLDGLKNRRTPHLGTLVPVLMLTGMRVGEALSLAWGQVDLMGQTITVGSAKTSSGTGRGIPINDDLASILAAHRAWFVERFGEPRPDHHLFPWGKPVPTDPARHATDITWGWDQLRKDTKVSCRLHDLRHTFATRLAENGVSESTMLALMGHMSRAMLESHIRMTAKREALSGIMLRPETGGNAPKLRGSPCGSPCTCDTGYFAVTAKYLKDLVSAEGIEPSTY